MPRGRVLCHSIKMTGPKTQKTHQNDFNVFSIFRFFHHKIKLCRTLRHILKFICTQMGNKMGTSEGFISTKGKLLFGTWLRTIKFKGENIPLSPSFYYPMVDT